MAKNWGQNISEQQLINKNIVQQVGIKYYIFFVLLYLGK